MDYKDRILALAVVLIWGFNFVVIKWGIEDVDPITMTILRFFLTAIPAIFFVKKPDIPMKYVVLYGIIFGAGVWGLINFAIFLGVPAGIASLLLQLSPFLTILVAILLFKEPIKTSNIVGILIALAGFLVVSISKSSDISYIGIFLVALSAIFWTICNTIIKYTKPKNVISFTVWSSLFVPLPIALFTYAFSLFSGNDLTTFVQIPSLKGWLSIIFQAIVTTLFGYAAWAYLIGKNGLSNIAPYSLLVPITGLFCGWWLYEEYLTNIELLGITLVVLGLAVTNIKLKTKG